MLTNLLPEFPDPKKEERFAAQLVESSWIVLDLISGAPMGRARYTVEIQARWTAEAMNEAYKLGLLAAARQANPNAFGE